MLPPLTNHAAWQSFVSYKGWWRDERGEDLCDGYRTARAHPALIRASVVDRLSDGLRRKLWYDVRRGVSGDLANGGKDVVEATVNYLFDQLDDPSSTDGVSLCLIYSTIVTRRRIDRVKAALAEGKRYAPLQIGSQDEIVGAHEAVTLPPADEPDDIDLAALLATIADPRKRDAFSLRHVDGVQVQEIARRYGKDVRTIRRWEGETRDVLEGEIRKARDA